MKAKTKKNLPFVKAGTEFENFEVQDKNVLIEVEGDRIGYSVEHFEFIEEREKPFPALLCYFKDKNSLPFYDLPEARQEFEQLVQFAEFVANQLRTDPEKAPEQLTLEFFDFSEYSTTLVEN